MKKEYVKKVSIKGHWSNYSYTPVSLKIKMKMFDGAEVKLNTTGKMTVGQIVDALIVNYKKAKK